MAKTYEPVYSAVGVNKTDYTSPRSNANQTGSNTNKGGYSKEYTEAIRNGNYTPPGYYRDGFGLLLPGKEPPGLSAAAEEALKTAKPPAASETPATPANPADGWDWDYIERLRREQTQPKVTYVDEDGNAKKGTTEETPTEPKRTYLDELRDQYQKMYDDAVKANNDAAKAAAERALGQVEQGVGELGTQYGNLNKQLYRDYMESLRTLPQEMAARGYSGGMSESARLGLDTAYGERLNENEAARLAAIAKLREQGADAEYQANAARDQANAQAQQNLYANLANLLAQQQQDKAQRAENMAQYGDFSGYLDLGYTEDEIAKMKKAWIAANPSLARTLGYVSAPAAPSYSGYYYGGGGNSSGDKVSGADAVAAAKDMIKKGMSVSEVMKNVRESEAAGEISALDSDAIYATIGTKAPGDVVGNTAYGSFIGSLIGSANSRRGRKK